jgi:hypothetical protein
MTSVKTRGKYFFNVRDNQGLSIDVLQGRIPSIFAQEPHESRSARYSYIPTMQILQGMIREGFIPVQAMQAKPRAEDKLGHAKHLVRFRKNDELGLETPETSEIVLVNSHDGSSSYHLMNGVFRMVCQNGLISGDLENNFKIPHKGNIIDNVIEAAYTIVSKSDETMESLQEMKSIALPPPEKMLFAEYALKARYNIDDESDEVLEPPVSAPSILKVRRVADNKGDLFTTMNVIQENILKGGISDGKKHTTRQINGIDQSVKLNKLIWSFAEELKKVHLAYNR